MKNVVFRDIRTLFIPHRRHYVSAPLRRVTVRTDVSEERVVSIFRVL
jgi:hypothetical protein